MGRARVPGQAVGEKEEEQTRPGHHHSRQDCDWRGSQQLSQEITPQLVEFNYLK